MLARRFATRVSVLALAGLLVMPAPGSARSRSRHRGYEPSAAGRFDYWVLGLSWSPEHCAERSLRPGDSQCATPRRYGFVAHGLWPQYENGGYPQTCPASDALPRSVIDTMLDIMPSDDLIRHEWLKHGTCSGLPADAYFQRVRQAFRTISIPERYQHPETAFRVTAATVRSDIAAANPSIPDHGIAVLCTGHFFTELRVCLSRDDLAPRRCGPKVSDRCEGEVTVRPLR
jgi:ribonuclease T2